jgi:hypothetical protein
VLNRIVESSGFRDSPIARIEEEVARLMAPRKETLMLLSA